MGREIPGLTSVTHLLKKSEKPEEKFPIKNSGKIPGIFQTKFPVDIPKKTEQEPDQDHPLQPDSPPITRSCPVFRIQMRTNTFISGVVLTTEKQSEVKITRSEKNWYRFPRFRYIFPTGRNKIVHFRFRLA
jgi:hypothetical protein